MQYDFDTPRDRSRNFSAKYDERGKKFGRQDVLPLWVADMDFMTAQPVIDAIVERAQQGIFGYTSRPASYFEAMCQWQKQRNGLEVDPAMVAFSPGVVPTLSALVKLFTKPQDSILIQTPVYAEFEAAINAWGRTPLNCPLVVQGGRYTVDLDRFEEALKKGPAMFILCSPHNPVGRVWAEDELRGMAELCTRYGVRIVSDEIHADLTLWESKHLPTAALSEEIAANTVTCLSGSKTFNLAGLQASFTVFANKADLKVYKDYWQRLDIDRNNCFSLVAMEAAFRHGAEWLGQLKTYLEGNLAFIQEACAARIPQIKANRPEASYLSWLDCRGLGLPDEALARFMVEEAGLGLNTGASFGAGGEGHMRLNAACPRSVLRQAMDQLQAAVARLG